MSTANVVVVGRNQFTMGYRPQGEWSWLITTAFFLGNVGAGLFLISYFNSFELGALVGLLIVGVGKSTAHLLYLGRPDRFLRIVARWRTSWISRGLIAMGAFLVCGVVYLARYLQVDFVPHGVTVGFGVAAAIVAVVVMVYDGFVLKASRGTPLWDTYLMPVLALFYALLGGTTLTLVVQAASGASTHAQLEWLEIALLALNGALVSLVIFTASARQAAVRAAVSLLTRGPMTRLFFGVAIGLGIVGTLALVGVSLATGSIVALVIAAVTDLCGHFFVFFSLLRVGLHPPLRAVSEPGQAHVVEASV
ncbi:MAG: polysulfide reductase NrfD [Actinomycetota bacterium]|nr:polysulfide reductase NrfD [Actinomycetota bacterium]